MTTEQVIRMTQELFLVSLLVSLPALAVSLIVGLAIVVALGVPPQQATEFARGVIGSAAGAGR